MKKLVVVNAGPRNSWNTDSLLSEAANGASENGYEVVKFNLFKLDKYTGCISCFGCKRDRFRGRCCCKDGLTPVLDAIMDADGLIIGSPNYLSELTASFRALYERLIFQNLTYNVDNYCCNNKFIPVLLVMTSNAKDGYYDELINNYKNTFDRFIGPTTTFIHGDTLQIKDYSKTDWEWSMFNPELKKKRHEEVFPIKLKEIKELSKKMFI